MTMDQQALDQALERVFVHPDMIAACERRDLASIIEICGKFGISQGKLGTLTGIAQGRLSEYKNRKRDYYRDTLDKFATGIGFPPNLRKALGLAPTSEVHEPLSDGATDILTDSFDIQLLAAEVGKRGAALERREVLALAATIGEAATLSRSGIWERLAYAISRPIAVDEATVREMENRSAGFYQLDVVMSSRTLFKGILAHLNDVTALLNGTTADPGDELRKRLIVVAGESSLAAGWWASDFGDMAAARSLYETAERAAREADDPAITACLLGYRSYVPSMKGAHSRSRAMLDRALDAVAGSDSPTAKAWLAARHAEESAALGDRKKALESWSQAEDAFSVADPEEDRVWIRFFDENRFQSCHISTYANIPGKLDKAEEIASNLISSISDRDRKRVVIVLGDIAIAHLRHGHGNEAARIAKDGLAALRESEFTMWLPKFEMVAKALTPQNGRAPVRAFLEDLAATRRQFSGSTH